jgi:hypothetical protein
MGAWGRGVWENDSALDDVSDVCRDLFESARKHVVEDFRDRTDIFTVLSRIEMITVLCTTIPCGPGIEASDLKSLKSAAIGAWQREVDPKLFSDGDEISEEKRKEWRLDIEAVFDRLLDFLRKLDA